MNKKIQFSKMHGLGNDFMIIENITQNCFISPKKIIDLSNRNTGIGFDQLLIVEAPYSPNVDFHYRIFNSNGSEVYQCGNGARCLAKFLNMNKLTNKKRIKISTKSRTMVLFINNNNTVCVNMGRPFFEPKKIPFNVLNNKKQYSLFVKNKIIKFGVVSIGNPHCVLLVKNIKFANVDFLGPILEKHALFPKKTNVVFVQIINDKYIKIRVYERDIGETKSCGSGACAAVAVGINQGILKNSVRVELIGGYLDIFWNGCGHSLFMNGPATHVYNGIIFI